MNHSHPQATQVGARCLREREGEMEALAEPLESQEGVWREVAGGHLAVRLLVAARRALALEPPDQEVDAGAAVLADSRGASARAGGQLAALTCGRRERRMRTVMSASSGLLASRGRAQPPTQQARRPTALYSSLPISPPPRCQHQHV